MEQLLQYCWKHRLFPLKQLKTDQLQTVEVIDAGLHNTNAGPDFLNAKVKIDGTLWVGNVEIHDRASDWFLHGHQNDTAYNNVILHVTQNIDMDVTTADGRRIPQLQLLIPSTVSENYQQLLTIDAYPPCYQIIPSLPSLIIHSWMSALQSERLEQKTLDIQQRLQQCKGDWETALFVTLARNFGFGINGDAFEQWAQSLPLHSVAHHRDDLFQIEAIFMGQAGLLNPEVIPQKYHQQMIEEGYFDRLRNEYLYLAHKFSLQSIDAKLWRFLRLRPQNFPYIRIAQLANLYHSQRFCLRNLVESTTLSDLKDILRTTVTPYWETHYLFGSVSKRNEKHLSEQSLNVLLINTVIPLLFAYGRHIMSDNLCARALDFLEQLKPEHNHIVSMWQDCGMEIQNAGDTQALIQLKKRYCERKDCLRCRFGFEYLKGVNNSHPLSEV